MGKVVATFFWYEKGVMHVSFLPGGQNVNSDCFIENRKSESSPFHFHPA